MDIDEYFRQLSVDLNFGKLNRRINEDIKDSYREVLSFVLPPDVKEDLKYLSYLNKIPGVKSGSWINRKANKDVVTKLKGLFKSHYFYVLFIFVVCCLNEATENIAFNAANNYTQDDNYDKICENLVVLYNQKML